jgi:AraC-like DNA-binding protein
MGKHAVSMENRWVKPIAFRGREPDVEPDPARDSDHPFAARLPHQVLANHVVAYVGYDRTSTRPVLRRLTALGSIVVVIDLDQPTRLEVEGSPAPAGSSPVSGLCDRPMTYAQHGRERGVIVELTPLGARALFGLPLREIANASVSLVDLIGSRARRLAEQLGEARGWRERFRLLDDRLTAWMLNGPELAPPVHGAWQQLTRSDGRTRISALAEQVGWTRQHLNARFREQIGLSPKSAARIARLHRAIHLATKPNPQWWSDIAAACGYTDQSHLILDFRALTGLTPTELITFDNSEGELYLGAHLPVGAGLRPRLEPTDRSTNSMA